MTSFSVEDASVRYDRVAALAGVDLEVSSGEAVGLVGPSGAGKTTLLRVLNGTLRATNGRVRVDGQDLSTATPARLRAIRASIGFVPQDLCLVPNLRVSQNVATGRLGRMSLLASFREVLWPPRASLERIHDLLERVGIGDKLFQRTDRLSGGQQQRVAVARALYQEPVALLADEPVSSVDPARARDTVELLTRVSRDRNLTLVMSLHNLELAREFFPRLVGLRGGRVVFDAASDTLPRDAFSRLYELTESELLGDEPS